jgi:hypothetical protein
MKTVKELQGLASLIRKKSDEEAETQFGLATRLVVFNKALADGYEASIKKASAILSELFPDIKLTGVEVMLLGIYLEGLEHGLVPSLDDVRWIEIFKKASRHKDGELVHAYLDGEKATDFYLCYTPEFLAHEKAVIAIRKKQAKAIKPLAALQLKRLRETELRTKRYFAHHAPKS